MNKMLAIALSGLALSATSLAAARAEQDPFCDGLVSISGMTQPALAGSLGAIDPDDFLKKERLSTFQFLGGPCDMAQQGGKVIEVRCGVTVRDPSVSDGQVFDAAIDCLKAKASKTDKSAERAYVWLRSGPMVKIVSHPDRSITFTFVY